MSVVTISRQFGAGGHTLAESLSNRLDYKLVDRLLVEKIAEEAKVSVQWVEAVEREAGGLLMRLVHSMVSSSFIDRLLGEDRQDFGEERYIKFLSHVVTNLWQEGGKVVIVGRGAQFILPNSEDIVKVLLVAELPDRIKFLEEHYKISTTKATELVRREDQRRSKTLKLFYDGNPDDPSFYTMVFNTSYVNIQEVEDLVVHLMEKIYENGDVAINSKK
ncbi:MAG: cytidylate kinase-like family protein [Desulfatibacillum sp.]|nr:cytidylate kinase-like family protein [Desulfatibacillum sp.]